MVFCPLVVGVTIFLFVLFKVYRLADRPVVFVFKILMEQGLGLSGKLGKLHGFKLFMSPFLLACLILSSLYRGEVTKNTTAQMPRKGLKLVDEAVQNGLTILLPIPIGKGNMCGSEANVIEFNQLNVSSTSWRHASLMHRFFSRSPIIKALANEHEFNLPKFLDRHPGILGSIKLVPVKNSSSNELEEELLKCNDTIYVDEKFKLDNSVLKAKQINAEAVNGLYYGKDNFLPYRAFWIMGPTQFDRTRLIKLKFQAIRQSGLFDRVYVGVGTDAYKAKLRIKIDFDSGGDTISKLSLHSGLVMSTFYMHFARISICVLVMLVELRIENFKHGVNFFRVIRNRLVDKYVNVLNRRCTFKPSW